MVTSIWEDIKSQFRYGNILIRIILVNTIVFVGVNLLFLLLFFIYGPDAKSVLNTVLTWLEASSGLRHNLTRPWTILTYMFLHQGLWHFIMNMLILYWFGRILSDLAGNQKILAIYVLGGFAGFLAYLFAAFLFPSMVGPYLLGASAGVAAVVLAAATLAPEYRMNLLLIGPVALKYIAAVFILLFLISIPGTNTGGEFAHLGGAFMGWFFIYLLRQGNDLSIKFNKVTGALSNYFASVIEFFSGKRGPRMAYKNPNKKKSEGVHKNGGVPDSKQEKVDDILEKIKRSGYQSLTTEEKEFLFKASKEK